MKRNRQCIFLVLFFQLYAKGVFGQVTPQQYIETYKDLAVRIMEEFGVPASVTLAVAMHESANGNSKVATYLHNHFGIKGQNNSREIRSSYKGYDSVQASYCDFIHYLQAKQNFSRLFLDYPAYDYRSWAHGIGKGGYAASKYWASQILAIIHKYRLFEFDNPPEEAYTLNDESVDISIPIEKTSTYVVRKGDTLAKIAKRCHTSIKQLKQQNQLRTDRLKIGQSLKI